MAAYNSKYHIGIDSKGYILDRGSKAVYAYQKKLAPAFVNKFGSGDSSYRDANFWQFWAQINWRNGSKQEKWGDGGKFWKSSDVDVSQLEQLKLSKLLSSAGQVESGAKITCMASWRTSQNWWDSNYGYRQQLSITAPSTSTVPINYPIKVTIDTAALQTASKVRSDRKDWRIVYWNGTSWVDLVRDYIDTTTTFFSIQATIAPGTTDSNYYVYYGYSGESTSKQPTTDSEWNALYYPKIDDTYVLGMWHMKEGSGNTLTDTDSTNDLTVNSGSASWITNGQFGRGVALSSGMTWQTPAAAELTVGSFTLEFYMKADSLADTQLFESNSPTSDGLQYYVKPQADGKILFAKWAAGSESQTSSVAIIPDTTNWYRYAITYDGASTVKYYRNGTLLATSTFSESGMRGNATSYLKMGNTDVNIQHLRYDNVVRTSFAGAEVGLLTASPGTEMTTQPPASSFTLYVGTNTGKAYTWDGATTFTLAKDFNILVDSGATTDTSKRVGDTSGTEYKQAQSFRIAKQVNLKSVMLNMKASNTTNSPTGAITVRIETDSSNAPSGTLVSTGATTTIANFTEKTYAYKTAEFTDSITLTAATKYWIVVSCNAQSNDIGWDISANSTSIYADGSESTYSPSSWTNNATTDLNFKLYTNSTSVNCAYITAVGGQKLLFGTGDISSQTNGDALLWSYDGTTWAISYAFKTSTECQITSMTDFSSKLYIGVGPQARVYETADLSTFTLSKDIDFPQKPGYVYTLKEYNSQLIASGGSPEFLPTKNYGGFSYVYNGTIWQTLYPFDHTVIKSAEFYDAFLFFGTYHGQTYTYNTSYLDPLFNFKDDYSYLQQVSCQKYFDDKLFLGLYPQTDSNDTNIGLWCFERHGMSMLNSLPSSVTGLTCLEQVNNILMVGTGDDGYVYKQDPTQYVSTGWLQTSYYDANLPSIPKLWNQFVINHDPLITGHTIQVYYKFKESDSWTEIIASPVATIGSTSTTYPFPNQISSNKISFKIVLSTSDSTTTPVIRETIMRYTLFPNIKYMWNMRIKCKSPMKLADETVDTRTAEDMRDELETMLETAELHTFVDIDGSSHTVLFHSLDEGSWVINQEDSSGSTVPITLIEV